MKKLIFALLISVLFVSAGYCSFMSNLTASTFFNIKTPQICYGGIESLANYKQIVSLDASVITDAQKVAYGGGIGIDIGAILAKYPGWDIQAISKGTKIGAFVAKFQWDTLTIDMYGLYIGQRFGK